MIIKTKGGIEVDVYPDTDDVVIHISIYENDGGSICNVLHLPPEEALLLSKAIEHCVPEAKAGTLRGRLVEAVQRVEKDDKRLAESVLGGTEIGG